MPPGGIGGGGGGGGGSAFTITLDRTAINLDFEEGSPPQIVTIHANAQGEYSGNIYVAATLEGSGINPTIPIVVSGTSATISVSIATGLTAGTYSGRINFMACSDSACNNRIGGTPIPVTFSLTVRPGLRLNPTALILDGQSGTGTSANVSVQLPPSQTGYLLSLSSSPQWWLSVPTQSATSFTVAARSMPSGTYTGVIHAQSGTSSVDLPVTYRVTAPPGGERPLQATPTSLTMGTQEGGQDVRTLTVQKPTWNPDSLGAHIEYSGSTLGWLTAAPVNGGFSVTASAASLAQGTYSATLRIDTEPFNQGDSIVVPVTLTVGPGLMQPAQKVLTLASDAPGVAPSASVRIDASDLGTSVNWVATADQPWLVLTRSNGQTGSDVEFNIDLATVKTWSPTSDHTAKIRVAGAATGITPVEFDVLVQMRLAEVIGVGPSALVAGQPQRLVIRGHNFSQFQDSLVSRLRIDGSGAPVSATRVGDTKIIADFGAVGLGPHTISVTNDLNMTTSTAAVRVIAAGAYAYKAIPINEGSMREPFVYDPITRIAYANSNIRVVRIPIDGTVAEPLPQGPYALGFSADGLDILAANIMSVSKLDPANLAILPATTISFTGLGVGTPQYADKGLVVSNDSRLWFEIHRALDLKSKTVSRATLAPGVPDSIYYDPRVVSRDGERVIGIEGPGSVGQLSRFTWLDASDSVLHLSSATYQTYPSIGVNDDGKRVLAGYSSVLDENLALVGNVALPASASAYDPLVAAISPDGARVYLVAYPRANYNNPTPDPSLKTRMYVFDSSTPVSTLPVLGYTELNDDPTCYNSGCFSPTYARVTPDGGALLVVSSKNLLVVPTNATLQPAAVTPGPGTQSVPRTILWK